MAILYATKNPSLTVLINTQQKIILPKQDKSKHNMKIKSLLTALLCIFPHLIWCQYISINDQAEKSQNIPSVYVFSLDNSQNIAGLMLSNREISISHIYPSPAVSYAAFNYKLSENIIAEITFYNVLGSQVGRYKLAPDKESIRILLDDLTGGIYFYTLSVNHKNLITRKFIIKK